jgi:WD40 repeat protein
MGGAIMRDRVRPWMLFLLVAVGLVAGVVLAFIPALRARSTSAQSPPTSQPRNSPPAVRLLPSLLPAAADHSPITAFAFSPSGELTVGTATGRLEFRGEDGTISERKGLGLDRVDGAIVSIAYSLDRATMAIATATTVYLVGGESGGTRIRLTDDPDPLDPISAVALSPDGRLLALGRFGVDLFDARTRRLLASLTQPVVADRGSYETIAFSADSQMLYASDYSGTETWVRTGWKLKSSFECRCFHHASFSSNARWASLGTADAHVLVWDAVQGRTVRTLTVSTAAKAYTGDTAVSNDGTMLVAGSGAGDLLVWKGDGRQPSAKIRLTDNEISSVALSPDSSRAVVGSAPAAGRGRRLWLVRITND